MWARRIAAVIAAVSGNLVHIYLGAMTIVGGWPVFVTQFRRGYELTACFICSVQSDLFIYLGWYGWPFYTLCIAAFVTRSAFWQVTTLLSIVGLIGLDIFWYYGGNSRDWYVVLSPIVLGGIAVVALLIILFASRSSSSTDAVQVKSG